VSSPGRFRDAEIASEGIHSSVQLLSLYHDTLLNRARAISKLASASSSSSPAVAPSLHSRYTRFWATKSAVYRRVAMILQIVQYTELLCEMAAKRRGERLRWRVVVLIEAIKALCRLCLLRITSSRPIVTPALPERQPVPDPPDGDDDDEAYGGMLAEEEGPSQMAGAATASSHSSASMYHSKDWVMPRTQMSLPALPHASDTTGYLLSRVLTADDVKPATRLLNQLQGTAQASEILHILVPLVYAIALSRTRDKRSWTPWLTGVALDYAARQLRDRGLRTTALERAEWTRRGWAMGWWAMRGAFYENCMKGVVGGVRSRVPSFIGGIIEDYEYLWENYYFSTTS